MSETPEKPDPTAGAPSGDGEDTAQGRGAATPGRRGGAVNVPRGLPTVPRLATPGRGGQAPAGGQTRLPRSPRPRVVPGQAAESPNRLRQPGPRVGVRPIGLTPRAGRPVVPVRRGEPSRVPPRAPGAPVRVGIVEPQALFRSVMADSLDNATDMQVAFQAGSCAEARARFRPGQVDVVAIEVEQPDGNGATLALTLQRADERLSVVLVTGHDVRAIVESTRQHLRRPWSYVSKKADVSAVDLVQTLRRAALAPDQAPPAIESGGPQQDPFKGLTAQQLAVLRLISEGFTNTQVADRLGLSRRTVENHLLGIYRIFEIGSDDVNPRVTAVLRFLSHTIKY